MFKSSKDGEEMTDIAYTCEKCGTLVRLTSYAGTPVVPVKRCFPCLRRKEPLHNKEREAK